MTFMRPQHTTWLPDVSALTYNGCTQTWWNHTFIRAVHRLFTVPRFPWDLRCWLVSLTFCHIGFWTQVYWGEYKTPLEGLWRALLLYTTVLPHHPYSLVFCTLPTFARIKRPRWQPVKLNSHNLQSQGCTLVVARSLEVILKSGLRWSHSVTNTGLLLYHQSHVDDRYKKSLIKTMVDHAFHLMSLVTWKWCHGDIETLCPYYC